MTVRQLFLSLLLSASVTTAACTNPLSSLFGGKDNSTAPSPATATTDTFNGGLAPSGSLTFTFSVTTAGNVAVTLTSVSPAATTPLAMGVGPFSNGNCAIANSTSAATAAANPQLSAMANPGTYCVKVSDPGSLTATSAVTVTVTHS